MTGTWQSKGESAKLAKRGAAPRPVSMESPPLAWVPVLKTVGGQKPL